VTLRHLLTHSSGLPDMLPENEVLRARHATVAEFAEGTAKQDPAFQPGCAISYCSMGFAVLACILEKVAEVTVSELLRERLLGPLGMRDSWLGLPEANAGSTVGRHDFHGGRPWKAAAVSAEQGKLGQWSARAASCHVSHQCAKPDAV
jgi:CubicO group peptidase (beta-lactamase class C family)